MIVVAAAARHQVWLMLSPSLEQIRFPYLKSVGALV
jgi:hypothetical protein